MYHNHCRDESQSSRAEKDLRQSVPSVISPFLMRKKWRSTVLSILPPLHQIQPLPSVLSATVVPQTHPSGPWAFKSPPDWWPSQHICLSFLSSIVCGRVISMQYIRAPSVRSGETTTDRLCDWQQAEIQLLPLWNNLAGYSPFISSNVFLTLLLHSLLCFPEADLNGLVITESLASWSQLLAGPLRGTLLEDQRIRRKENSETDVFFLHPSPAAPLPIRFLPSWTGKRQ